MSRPESRRVRVRARTLAARFTWAALALSLAACARDGRPPPATFADFLVPPRPSPAPAAGPFDPAGAALRLRGQVVLGARLLGGSAARAAATPAPPASSVPEGDLPVGPLDRARARAAAESGRALAVERLVGLWARDGGDPAGPGGRREPFPDEVRQAQRLLAALGYHARPVDGVNGPASREAVRRFQAVRGLPETGEVTPALLAAL